MRRYGHAFIVNLWYLDVSCHLTTFFTFLDTLFNRQVWFVLAFFLVVLSLGLRLSLYVLDLDHDVIC